MERHFMIDIETTGIDPEKEDLLEIGIVEVQQRGSIWHPVSEFRLLQGSERQPESEFAKKHMAELYKICNGMPYLSAETLRSKVLAYLQSRGCEGAKDTYFMGWNASNFDLPFLVKKGVLVPNYYELVDGKDVMRGDFHYRVYEMGGALSLAQNVIGIDRSMLTKAAEAAGKDTAPIPEGKEHDALYDCYKQIRILNGLIKILRGER